MGEEKFFIMLFKKKKMLRPIPVAQVCNPSYLGG
jgi:hypothetical protein